MIDVGRITVLYGSQTFTAQEAAEKIWRTTKALGFRGPVQAMDEYDITELIHEDFVVFVCATTGQGDEPDNMKRFWKFLLRRSLPNNSLQRLKFGVIGLGDSSYNKFNFVGKRLHKRLIQLGATPLLNIGLCDYQHDLGHDAIMIPWLQELFSKLSMCIPGLQTDNFENKFIPRWKVELIKNHNKCLDIDNISDDIYFGDGKKDKFCESMLMECESNIRTTSEQHFQDVRLISFLREDKKLNYSPGDVFNIRPRNSKEDIASLFQIFETHNMDIKPHYHLLVEQFYEDMPVPEFLKKPLTMYKIAEQYWDLKFIPTPYVFSLLALVSKDKLERDKCIELSSPQGQEDWLNYCRRPKRTVLEVLEDFHKSTSQLTIPILFELFSSIKPRSFSIASSCLHTGGRRIELLVAVVEYYTKLKKARLGLCSNWLKSLKVGDKVYGWMKKGSLVFPEVPTPIIMVGPGTGLAPFRSLIFERLAQGSASKDTLYLFFGCRNKEKDFHCRDELQKLVDDGQLTLFYAFSRDQENKIYVQHKIADNKEVLWPLIKEREAHIYISGNAKNMPNNVKDAFAEQVLSDAGGLSLDDAKKFMKEMETKGRVQTETW